MSSLYLSLTTLLSSILSCGVAVKVAIAQVTPDTSLLSESSNIDTVTVDGDSTYTITGGATRGTNLFHSFDQFSIPTGDSAVFNNAATIENIISRVTGTAVSTLDGTIRANANANLFLLNPQGIVIGPDARLDIGGSFVASTGAGLRFANDFVYDATTPTVPPLLTISAPVGLAIGNTPGDVSVNGLGGLTAPDLSVEPGQTLALIGGDISLTGVQLMAPGGRIELGSVNQATELSITPLSQGFDIGFDGVNSYDNIQIAGRSVLDVSGRGGGTIELQGQTVTLSEQSALISDTLADLEGGEIQILGDQVRFLDSSYIGAATLGSGAASNVNITATQDIEFIGTAIANYKTLEVVTFLGVRQITDRQIGGITTATIAPGRTGDISLNTQRLVLDEGVQVSTESFGPGNSGDIEVIATESIQVRGSGILAGSRVLGVPLLTPEATATGLSTIGIPAGSGGNIDIYTTRLAVENGSSIVTGTISDQDSGNVSITATESVIMRGDFRPFVFPTSITTVSIGGLGAAGDLFINTGRLSIQDGGLIFADSGVRTLIGDIEFGGPAGNVTIEASEEVDIVGGLPLLAIFTPSNIRSRTFSDAPAGTIEITTPILNVRDGGRITSETQNSGRGGAINIDAETVVVSGGGGNNDPNAMSGIFADSGVALRNTFITGEIESVPADGIGGTITIDTTHLAVKDTAEITVGSFSAGPAGNLDISADIVELDSEGKLIATTTPDGGGNINVTSNILALNNNSTITASSESGDGGNLTFNLRDVLLLRNGSLISTEAGTARAGGDGGGITLNLPNGFIVAVPAENSDIRANAFEGNGGNVNVTARSLLGIAFRPVVLDTPLSDITASSQFGNSGTVTIDEINSDVVQTDIDLPVETAPTTLAQGCRAQGTETGSFVSTGRGGLPTNPTDVLSADAIWQDLAPIEGLTEEYPASPHSDSDLTTNSSPIEPLVEADSWTRSEDGTVALITHQTDSSGYFEHPESCEA